VKKRLLVLFLGNILRGDDGVGIELLKRLSTREFPKNVVLQEGSTGGMILLGLMDDYDSVIVVDAMDSPNYEGDFAIFNPSYISDSEESELSLHSISIKDIVRFNEAIGGRVPQIRIFGIRIYDTGEHIGLSAKLSERLPSLMERLYQFICETATE
jgi:hydrogenase maturation protease